MGRKNGVSDLIGKLLSRKSGGSAHSTQQCKPVKIEKPLIRPYMAEACGGCDDTYEEIFGDRQIVVGGLN